MNIDMIIHRLKLAGEEYSPWDKRIFIDAIDVIKELKAKLDKLEKKNGQ